MPTPPSDKATARLLGNALLAPRAVALIGQSNDADKTAGRPLKYLRQAGYAGRIYPINPRRDEVLGERAWPSLADLPEVPDHAYIVASTDATMDAIEECGRIGVPMVTALANGFSETGAEGTARETRIKQLLKDSDGEAHLIRFVLDGLPAPGPHELVQVELPVRGRRVDLRGRDVLLSEHAYIREGPQVSRHEQSMEGKSILFQLFREGADRAFLYPKI